MTRLKDSLEELDLPYFKRDSVIETNKWEDWKSFKLDFCIPGHSMRILVKFCEKNRCNLSFNEKNGHLEITVFEPKTFVVSEKSEC